MNYPLTTGVEKIRHKRPQSLEESTDVIFIENGQVVFSLSVSDEPKSIFGRRLPRKKNIKYGAMQSFLGLGVPAAQLTGKFASMDDRDCQFACGGLDITLDTNRTGFKQLSEFLLHLQERFEIFTQSVEHFSSTYMSYRHTFKSHICFKIL